MLSLDFCTLQSMAEEKHIDLQVVFPSCIGQAAWPVWHCWCAESYISFNFGGICGLLSVKTAIANRKMILLKIPNFTSVTPMVCQSLWNANQKYQNSKHINVDQSATVVADLPSYCVDDLAFNAFMFLMQEIWSWQMHSNIWPAFNKSNCHHAKTQSCSGLPSQLCDQMPIRSRFLRFLWHRWEQEWTASIEN